MHMLLRFGEAPNAPSKLVSEKSRFQFFYSVDRQYQATRVPG